jgi:hypothetical protein
VKQFAKGLYCVLNLTMFYRLLFFFLLITHLTTATGINPDDINRVVRHYYVEKKKLAESDSLQLEKRFQEYFELGCYDLMADSLSALSHNQQLLWKIRMMVHRYDYESAVDIVRELSNDISNPYKNGLADLYVSTDQHFRLGDYPAYTPSLNDETAFELYFDYLIKIGSFQRADSLLKTIAPPHTDRLGYYESVLNVSRGDIDRAFRLINVYLRNAPLDVDARFLYAYLLWAKQDPRNWRKIYGQLQVTVMIDPYHHRANHLLAHFPYEQVRLDKLENNNSLESIVEATRKDSTNIFYRNSLLTLWNREKSDFIILHSSKGESKDIKKVNFYDQIMSSEQRQELCLQLNKYGSFIDYLKLLEIEAFEVEPLTIALERDKSDLINILQSSPEQYLSEDDEAESEDLELMRAGISNAHLFHLVKTVYHRTLTRSEQQKVREQYLQLQVTQENTWFLGKNEDEFFYNAFCRFFEIPGSLYYFSPNFSSEELQQKYPGVYEIMEYLFVEKDAGHPLFELNEATVLQDEARIFLDQENIEKAKEYYGQAISKDTVDWEIVLFEARILMAEGKIKEAENHCLELLTKNPELAEAFELLSKIELRKSDHPSKASISQSILYLGSAVKVAADPGKSLDLSLKLFRAYLRAGEYVNALQIADEYFTPLYIVSGNLYTGVDPSVYSSWLKGIMGYGTDSYSQLKKFTEQDPYNYEINLMYAESLEAIQQYTKAARHLEGIQRRLSAFGILNGNYMLTIAENYLHLGDSVTAYYAVQPLVEGGKFPIDDQYKYARVLAGIGRTKEANDILNSQPIPDNSYDYSLRVMTQGYFAFYENDMDEAIELFKEALELNPYNLYARTQLIRIFSKNREKNKAELYIQSALALDLPPGETYLEQVYNNMRLFEN